MKGEDFTRDLIALAQRIGKIFGVKGVVLVWVFRYEDRIGNAIFFGAIPSRRPNKS